MEGLVKSRAKFTVDLHPSKLTNARAGVRSYLGSLLLRYNDDLGGVMLSYANERLLTQAAAIHPYFPFVRVDVVADIVLFRPRPGMQLVGKVNKVGMDYIGLLLLGFINVSLAAEQIRAEFKPRLAEHCWVSTKAPQHRLAVGDKVCFTVASVSHHGQFMSIAGSLVQPGTGAVGFSAHAVQRKTAKGQQTTQQAQHVQQQQQQGQQQEEKQQQEKKQKKKKVKGTALLQHDQAAPPPPSAQQQPQQPQQQLPGQKSKKDKRKDKSEAGAGRTEQQTHLPSGGGLEAAAPAAQASEGLKKQKERKRRAEAEAAPAALAPDGAAEKPKKKKKKDKN